MTREEKIAAIYKEMANKECSFGCRYILQDEFKSNIFFEAIESEGLGCTKWDDDICKIDDGDYEYSIHKIKEIIGHPVMIGDVLRQIRLLAGYALDNDLIKKSDFGNVIAQHNYRITQIWENFREPIEDQSDECIDYVYNLIQKD